jgi:uncharacterized protein YecE (DUF72 family)
MKFGKVFVKNELENIDFSLPKTIFSKHANKDDNHDCRLHVGAPAWGYKEWIGKIYPPKTKAKDFLKYYSQNFNSIELNSTHYTNPALETIKLWKSQVPENFKFCPKVSKKISHLGGMNNGLIVKEFFDLMRNFDERLGVIFLQLSENFSPKRSYELRNFIKYYPKDIKLSIEFRHPDWFKDENDIFNVLQDNNISLAISDTAGRRDVVYPRITADHIIVRFVGNDLHHSDFERIDAWIEKLKEWQSLGVNEIYFFLHEPEDINCPEIADYFVTKVLENKLGNLERLKFLSPEAQQISLL